jgi:hypothetical protein
VSSRAPSPTLAFLTAALLVGGCTKESSTPEPGSEADSRTLQKLQEEAARVKRGGAPSARPAPPTEPEESRLAGLAAGMDDTATRKLRLPERNETVHVDTVAMKLTGLEVSHSVKGGSSKVGLGITTEELFLRVELITQNVGQAPAPLSLDGVKVVDSKGQAHPLARDAQAVAGTRPLPTQWEPGQRTELVLLFEVPPEAVQDEGLVLGVQGSGGDVRIPLR